MMMKIAMINIGKITISVPAKEMLQPSRATYVHYVIFVIYVIFPTEH